MDGTDKVLMTCYGEGAGSEGDAHEAFNFAAIYNLPEIFVCENNGFAISTPFRKEYALEYVAQRAAGYGFPGVTVDGRDPVTCYVVSEPGDRPSPRGPGPDAHRVPGRPPWRALVRGRPAALPAQEEIDRLAQNDCLGGFKKRLLEEGVLSAKEIGRVRGARQRRGGSGDTGRHGVGRPRP